MGTDNDKLHYWFTATCDMEDFSSTGAKGSYNRDSWFSYLKDWKKQLQKPIKITTK
ncbi:MAG: DUF4861 family protein [Prevotella sp.]|nr:DUF4861 family protein [Prevotella sp.]